MDSLMILIPVALVFVAIAVKAFLWAVDNRQYDDLDAAAESILFDDVSVTILKDDNKETGPEQNKVGKCPVNSAFDE